MRRTVYFAGGCFWGIEQKFNTLNGVIKTQVGYMGGKTRNPSYEDVCSGRTGHVETVKVIYDTDKISYNDLLEFFFSIHDPTSLDKQGMDVGTQYKSIVFYSLKKQLKEFQDFISDKEDIVTEIRKKTEFYKAEDYHQLYNFQKKCKNIRTENVKTFKKICKNNTTVAEPKFKGKYLKNSARGIYVCSCCGQKLYNSNNQYDSGSGWPAFTKPYRVDNILYNDKTNELRCSNCGLHLGHRLFDAPTETKIHDCINSACLYFIHNKKTKSK